MYVVRIYGLCVLYDCMCLRIQTGKGPEAFLFFIWLEHE